jgi:hypothetical protein
MRPTALRAVLLATAGLLPAVGPLGCLSGPAPIPPLTAGGPTQQGEVTLRGQNVEVKYPVPYSSPPDLYFTSNPFVVKVIELRADGFVVALRPDYGPPWPVKWKAQPHEQPTSP